MRSGLIQQRYIAKDPAHAPHVLVFQITAVAPAQHDHSQAVFAWQQIIDKIEFRRQAAVLTVANPLSVSGDNADSSLPRENGSQVRVVTASDLQLLVSLLWQSGAEAIAINGNRLGVQTSIRTAGSTILIGVNSVQSPYRIEAIGNQATLAKSVSKTTQKQLYDDFKKAGIYPQISKSKSITLDAAVAGDTTHVRKDK